MKCISLKLVGTIFLFFIAALSFSQGTLWRIEGNNNTNPTSNFLGTDNNFGLSIRTDGIERIYIRDSWPAGSVLIF